MRERRIDNGTLSIQSLRLKFDLDEAGAPVDCSEELQTEANYLIAEVGSLGRNSPMLILYMCSS
jgi:protein SSD1